MLVLTIVRSQLIICFQYTGKRTQLSCLGVPAWLTVICQANKFIHLFIHFETVHTWLSLIVIAKKWFLSYLRNRQQHVQIQDTKSNFLTVKSGVPQSSVFGPLLCLLYVNDMVMVSSMANAFADDTNLFFSGMMLILWPNLLSAKCVSSIGQII